MNHGYLSLDNMVCSTPVCGCQAEYSTQRHSHQKIISHSYVTKEHYNFFFYIHHTFSDQFFAFPRMLIVASGAFNGSFAFCFLHVLGSRYHTPYLIFSHFVWERTCKKPLLQCSFIMFAFVPHTIGSTETVTEPE